MPIIQMAETLQKAKKAIKAFFTLDNFRRTGVYTLTTTCTFYFTNISPSILTSGDPLDVFRNYLVLKFIGIGLLIYGFFYIFIEYLFRLLFHGYIKGRFLKFREVSLEKGKYAFLKDVHFIQSMVRDAFYKYVYRLGLLTKKDVQDDFTITEHDKEELLNAMLNDCYKWFCFVLHSAFTIIIVGKYLTVAVVILLIFFLLLFTLFAFMAILFAMNLDVLKKVRRDILKSRSI